MPARFADVPVVRYLNHLAKIIAVYAIWTTHLSYRNFSSSHVGPSGAQWCQVLGEGTEIRATRSGDNRGQQESAYLYTTRRTAYQASRNSGAEIPVVGYVGFLAKNK